MQFLLSIIGLFALIVAIPAVLSVALGCLVRDSAKHSAAGVLLSAAPALMMLGLFYSLAIHMRQALGAWPSSIGENGFPPRLAAHAAFAVQFFQLIVLASIFVWPIAVLACICIRRWRGAIYYLAIYAASCFLCLGLMLLAPAPYLTWWED
jgi:hypothetical protein